LESLPASLVWFLAALVAVVAWAILARWLFFFDAGLEVLEVATADGWTIKARVLPSPRRRFSEPVILCPGLANNHRLFDLTRPASLARALAEAGFDCYLVDLRAAHGRHPKGSRRDASVDDHVAFDVPALVKAALVRSRAERAFWVGHSLGGLVGLAAAQTPGLPLAGMVAIGSPIFFRHGAVTRALLRAGSGIANLAPLRGDWAMLLLAPLAGWFHAPFAKGMVNQRNVAGAVQRRAMASMFSPIWRSVLVQFLDWEANDVFRSRQGVDWRAGLKGLEVPTLLIAGSSDLLADAASMGDALALVGAADKSLLLFGKAYGHGDLLIGKSAAHEVFPPLTRWLEQRATERDSRTPP
jgi:pimeloyl-ACP methyl ester carboxylesterase